MILQKCLNYKSILDPIQKRRIKTFNLALFNVNFKCAEKCKSLEYAFRFVFTEPSKRNLEFGTIEDSLNMAMILIYF